MKHLKTKLGELVAKLAEELNPDGWRSIDQLRAEVREQNMIDRDDADLVSELLSFAESELIRRAMRRKQETGFPLFPSITVPTRDGKKTTRLYMPERRMKVIHYKQYGVECHDRAVYWMKMENATGHRCNERYGKQMEIVWPEMDGDGGK